MSPSLFVSVFLHPYNNEDNFKNLNVEFKVDQRALASGLVDET